MSDTCFKCKDPAIVTDDGRGYCKIHYLLLMRDIVKEKTMKNFEVNFSKQKELYSVNIRAKDKNNAQEKIMELHNIDEKNIRSVFEIKHKKTEDK